MKQFLSVSILLLFFLQTTFLRSQNNFSYKKVDSLLKIESSIDANLALNILREKFSKDTLNSKYWASISKIQYINYNYRKAKKSIEKAIKLNPKKSDYYFEKGLLYHNTNNLETAFSSFNKAIQLQEKGKYYYYRGIVNQMLGKDIKALSDYESALKNNFSSIEIYNNVAIILTNKKDYLSALEAINKAIEINPNYGEIRSTKAKILFTMLDIDASCSESKKNIDLGFKNTFQVPSHICNGNEQAKLKFLAEVLASGENYTQAIKAFSKLINLNYLEGSYFLNRGYCYFKTDKIDLAEKDYLEAFKYKDTQKEQLLDNISLLYFNEDKFEESIKYCTQSIELTPKNPAPYIYRGACFRKLKNYEKAKIDFDKAIEIDPYFFRAYGYRSYLYLIQEDFEKAFNDAKKSVEINPNYGYGYLILAQAKQQLNKDNFCEDLILADKFGEKDALILMNEFCK